MSATAVAATVASASNKCFMAHNNLHLLRHHHSNSYKHKDNNNSPLLFLCCFNHSLSNHHHTRRCRLLLGPSSTNSSTAFHASFPFLFNTSYTTPPSWNPNAFLSSPSSSSTPFRPPVCLFTPSQYLFVIHYYLFNFINFLTKTELNAQWPRFLPNLNSKG